MIAGIQYANRSLGAQPVRSRCVDGHARTSAVIHAASSQMPHHPFPPNLYHTPGSIFRRSPKLPLPRRAWSFENVHEPEGRSGDEERVTLRVCGEHGEGDNKKGTPDPGKVKHGKGVRKNGGVPASKYMISSFAVNGSKWRRMTQCVCVLKMIPSCHGIKA